MRRSETHTRTVVEVTPLNNPMAIYSDQWEIFKVVQGDEDPSEVVTKALKEHKHVRLVQTTFFSA